MSILRDSCLLSRVESILVQVRSLKRYELRRIHKRLKKHPSEAIPLAFLFVDQGEQAVIERLRQLDWIN
jgi:hypothetical protein